MNLNPKRQMQNKTKSFTLPSATSTLHARLGPENGFCAYDYHQEQDITCAGIKWSSNGNPWFKCSTRFRLSSSYFRNCFGFSCFISLCMLSRSTGIVSWHFALALSFSASAAQCCRSWEIGSQSESADWPGSGYVHYDSPMRRAWLTFYEGGNGKYTHNALVWVIHLHTVQK